MTAENSHWFALTEQDPEGRNPTIIVWRETDLVDSRVARRVVLTYPTLLTWRRRSWRPPGERSRAAGLTPGPRRAARNAAGLLEGVALHVLHVSEGRDGRTPRHHHRHRQTDPAVWLVSRYPRRGHHAANDELVAELVGRIRARQASREGGC